jgi:hypothetical protein
MWQYEIYIQLENIETRFILFTYRHQQWRPEVECLFPAGMCARWRQFFVFFGFVYLLLLVWAVLGLTLYAQQKKYACA